MIRPLLWLAPALLAAQSIPRTWDEAALKDWATPIAGLGVRPGHFSVEEYYNSPVDNYHTCPVYAAGREPAGYWNGLRATRPARLFDRAKVKTNADWVAAGKTVFAESDIAGFRRYEPEIIEEFHKATSKRIAALKPQRRNHPRGALGSHRSRTGNHRRKLRLASPPAVTGWLVSRRPGDV